MTTIEIIQRQLDLARYLTNAVNEYQRAIAEAAAYLERELSQIESARQQDRQDAEREYQRVMEAIFTPEPVTGKLKQAVLAEAEVANITPARDLDSVGAVRSALVVQQPTKIRAASTTETIILIGLLLVGLLVGPTAFCGLCLLFSQGGGLMLSLVFAILVVLFALIRRIKRRTISLGVSKVVRIKALYLRWLEIIDNEAQRQKAAAEGRYRQACEQAEQALQARVEQLKQMVSQFTASAHPISPPWKDTAWQDWKPADRAAGIIRLGTLVLTPSQDLQRR